MTVNPHVRATIALENLARLLPRKLNEDEWSAPVTMDEAATALELAYTEVAKLITRASRAEAALEGVESALQTLFGTFVPRYMMGVLPDRPEGTKPFDPELDRWDTCGVRPNHGPHLGGSGDWNCTGLTDPHSAMILRAD